MGEDSHWVEDIMFIQVQPRQRPDAGPTSSLVWNPFHAIYVAQSPVRMQRLELADTCAFCADVTSGRIPPTTRAWIRPNDFPALQPPTGECYILIYAAGHDRSFADLSVDEVVRVVALWQRVYTHLSRRYPAVMTWETSGEAIGQTQRHPHGQTYGVSILPDTLARELRAIEEAHAKGQGCPYCREVREESGGPRAVLEGEHWLAYVPRYARYPYQVHLSPRRHLQNISVFDVQGASARELAGSLSRIVRAYHRIYEHPMPYMLAVHQLADERFHLHVELLPVGRAQGKLKLAASSEMAWGLWLNDATAESKAEELRALVEQEHAE
ncbi:MAG TPA: galactose-1-phosphate uridylyltransferase [Ktedonobacterales bacterium]|nr:galactose-1-phosphate uridylyltransferase [Ktedonobacterales bacterium]